MRATPESTTTTMTTMGTTMAMRPVPIMTTTMAERGAPEMLTGDGLYRLMTWLSPGFPVGAFSYSHGIETAIERGLVTDRATLEDWIAGILKFGAGASDALLFRAAHEALDDKALAGVIELGQVWRSTAELAH